MIRSTIIAAKLLMFYMPDALIIQLDIVSDFTPLTLKIALTPFLQISTRILPTPMIMVS